MKDQHLSNDDFAAYMLDPALTAEAASHLRDCAQCSNELDLFQFSVDSFSATTFAWSERLCVARPSRFDAGKTAGGRHWFMGLAFASLFVVAMQLHFGWQGSVASEQRGTANSDENSEAAIARDNQLLRKVNDAINEKESFPLLAYNNPVPKSGAKMRKEAETGSE